MFVASLRTNAAVALVFVLLADHLLPARDRQLGRQRRHGRSRRLVRPGDGGGGLVCIVCGGRQFDLRADGLAGPAAGSLSRRGAANGNARGVIEPGRAVERTARGRELRALRGVPLAGPAQRSGDLRAGGGRPGGLVAGAVQAAARLGAGAEREPRRLQPALLQVVRRRQAERLGQLPRPPRRGGAGRPGRLPLARRGGRGARHHLRRAARRRAALRQRAQGRRRRGRRHRRDLPADDPRGRRRDARLRPHRRPPQRRLRRLLGRGGAGADGVLRGEGAGHRRRRPAQGQDGADQAAGRRADGRPGEPGDDRRRPPHRDRLPDARGARPLLRRADGGRRARVPGRAASTPSTRSTSSTPPARPRSRRGSCTPPAAT